VDPLLRTPKRPLSNVIFQESSENLTEPFSLKDLGIFDGPLRPFSNVIFQKIQKIGDEPFSLKERFRDFSWTLPFGPLRTQKAVFKCYLSKNPKNRRRTFRDFRRPLRWTFRWTPPPKKFFCTRKCLADTPQEYSFMTRR
jgi:hypothetical protein